MSTFEVLYLAFYLLFIIATTVAIQILNPGAVMREYASLQEKEDSEDLDTDLQEPDSTQEENYAMTENPMFRHRKQEDEEEKPSSPHESHLPPLPDSPKSPKVEKID